MNETLKEAAERNHNEQTLNTYTPYSFNDAFKDGAKWQQQKMYTEEEVLKLLINFSNDRTFLKKDVAIRWFEQFKKK